MRLLGRFEDILIESDVLTSDFTVMALQRRDAANSPPEANPRRRPILEAEFQNAELEAARAELAQVKAYLHAIETSRGWRLLQRIRGLFGLRWTG